ncbi:MAG: alpha/beta hydrolase [Solirubrobacteraceae bacterium]
MNGRPLPFFASGLRLDADLHLPDTAGEPAKRLPVLVAASGYLGLKAIHPERFARALTARGYAVLAFDYRGFGLSEGERGRLAPQDQVQDVRAAVDRLSVCDEVDPERIGLLGWGLGGGVMVAEAADDPRVRAVAAVNGVSDGARSTRNLHDERSWATLLQRIEADRGRRATAGRSEVVSPWDIVPLQGDSKTPTYVFEELYRTPGYGTGVTLESADLLLQFSPQTVAARLAGRPLLIVHGADNELYRPVEAQALYDHAAEPKRLVYLQGAGHTEWMFDLHPTFAALVQELAGFFDDALASAGATATERTTP